MEYFSTFGNLQATKKLYHDDYYQTSAKAQVIACSGNLLVLDQTVFYALSGGQDPDFGTIDGYKVLDVQKCGGRELVINNADLSTIMTDTYFVHILEKDVRLLPGQEVLLNIDWERRYLHMQLHSLAHLLVSLTNCVIKDRGEAPQVVGCHVSTRGVRVDYFNKVNSEELGRIMHDLNLALGTTYEITMTRSADEDDLFVWQWQDIKMLCGGTHIKSFSEVQYKIKLRRESKGSHRNRVELSFV